MLKEYCNEETFIAKCNHNEAVLVTRATYGRMQIGKCIAIDYGSVGCKSDIMHYMTRECSGKTACSVEVNDIPVTDHCPSDLKSYLQAQFVCIPVAGSTQHKCRSEYDTTLTEHNLYLSSDIADSSSCGSQAMPWNIKAKSGQVIAVYLIDLSSDLSSSGCVILAYAYEVLSSRRTEITFCNGDDIEKPLYKSKSHVVKISFEDKTRRNSYGSFLLKYEAVGCADFENLDNVVYTRNHSSATITCKHEDKSWHLVCVDGVWNGVLGNCSRDTGASTSIDDPASTSAPSSLPMSVWVAIIVAIAVVMSSIIVVFGLICLCHTRPKEPEYGYGIATISRSASYPYSNTTLPRIPEQEDNIANSETMAYLVNTRRNRSMNDVLCHEEDCQFTNPTLMGDERFERINWDTMRFCRTDNEMGPESPYEICNGRKYFMLKEVRK